MFDFHITNGHSQIGIGIRYYGYTIIKDKSKVAISGSPTGSQCDSPEDRNNIFHYYLPFGESYMKYKDVNITSFIVKEGNITEESSHKEMYPYHITLKMNLSPEEGQALMKEFLVDAKKYYLEVIRDLTTDPNKISVHFFDEYWDVLNKRNKRKIDTIHLDGKEKDILDTIRNFLKPETKQFYENLGIPYKYNILFEGLPGTGKTSLIYTLASELNMNIAILNFNKDMDDNAFMRALRRLPKNSIFVLEDIDVLFKERKENDNYKSMISFSGLLNSLDGMAFKDNLITIMTTNYECNLDIALKRPGRIDTSVNFGFAKESQVKEMYNKFFLDKTEDFKTFYKEIKGLHFTTAMIQQYFIWHMYSYDKLIEDLDRFRDLCSKHNYEKKLDLYL